MISDQLSSGSDAFSAAMQWLQGTLLGSLASSVAIIAVAITGLCLLTGRIDIRRGAQVIFGCFTLFGASSIAAGILRISNPSSASIGDSSTPTVLPLPVQPPTTTKSVPYDPYAGAALATRN